MADMRCLTRNEVPFRTRHGYIPLFGLKKREIGPFSGGKKGKISKF